MSRNKSTSTSLHILANADDLTDEIRRAIKDLGRLPAASSKASQGVAKATGSMQKNTKKMGFVMQNVGYGLEDFFMQFQHQGFAGGLRAASNNISVIASTLSPMSGMFVGVAASLAAMWLGFNDQANRGAEGLENLKKKADDFREAVERLKGSFKQERDLIAFRKEMEGLVKEAKELRKSLDVGDKSPTSVKSGIDSIVKTIKKSLEDINADLESLDDGLKAFNQSREKLIQEDMGKIKERDVTRTSIGGSKGPQTRQAVPTKFGDKPEAAFRDLGTGRGFLASPEQWDWPHKIFGGDDGKPPTSSLGSPRGPVWGPGAAGDEDVTELFKGRPAQWERVTQSVKEIRRLSNELLTAGKKPSVKDAESAMVRGRQDVKDQFPPGPRRDHRLSQVTGPESRLAKEFVAAHQNAKEMKETRDKLAKEREALVRLIAEARVDMREDVQVAKKEVELREGKDRADLESKKTKAQEALEQAEKHIVKPEEMIKPAGPVAAIGMRSAAENTLFAAMQREGRSLRDQNPEARRAAESANRVAQANKRLEESAEKLTQVFKKMSPSVRTARAAVGEVEERRDKLMLENIQEWGRDQLVRQIPGLSEILGPPRTPEEIAEKNRWAGRTLEETVEQDLPRATKELEEALKRRTDALDKVEAEKTELEEGIKNLNKSIDEWTGKLKHFEVKEFNFTGA